MESLYAEDEVEVTNPSFNCLNSFMSSYSSPILEEIFGILLLFLVFFTASLKLPIQFLFIA